MRRRWLRGMRRSELSGRCERKWGVYKVFGTDILWTRSRPRQDDCRWSRGDLLRCQQVGYYHRLVVVYSPRHHQTDISGIPKVANCAGRDNYGYGIGLGSIRIKRSSRLSRDYRKTIERNIVSSSGRGYTRRIIYPHRLLRRKTMQRQLHLAW